MQGVVQKQAIFRQRILRQTHIVDQQEVADRSLVLDLLGKELSEDSAHMVGIGSHVLENFTIAIILLIRVNLRSWMIPECGVVLK